MSNPFIKYFLLWLAVTSDIRSAGLRPPRRTGTRTSPSSLARPYNSTDIRSAGLRPAGTRTSPSALAMSGIITCILPAIIFLLASVCCSANKVVEKTSGPDKSESTSAKSGQSPDESQPSDESAEFNVEYYPITAEQLEKVDVKSGDPENIDVWSLNFRGFDRDGKEVFLEAAYSPDSEVIYVNALYSGADKVFSCETSETGMFVDLIEYINSEPDIFLDQSEFAFGIPGMFHYPTGSTETFSIIYNEKYIIARGYVPDNPRPEIVHAIDMIKSTFLDLVVSGNCD